MGLKGLGKQTSVAHDELGYCSTTSEAFVLETVCGVEEKLYKNLVWTCAENFRHQYSRHLIIVMEVVAVVVVE